MSSDSGNLIAEIEQIYRSVPLGLCVVDSQLCYRRVNTVLASMNGRPVDDHLGRRMVEVIPDVAESVEAGYRRVFQTGESIEDVEVRGCSPAAPGVEQAWKVSYHPIASPGGGVDAVLTIVREAEVDVRPKAPGVSDHDMLTDVIDRLPMGVILVSAGAAFVHANSEACRILDEGTLLRVDWDGLRAATSKQTARLRYLIACAAGQEDVRCQAMRLRCDDEASLAVVVSRFRRSGVEAPPGIAMIVVSDGTGQIRDSAHAIEVLYGLTPAEAEVVLHLSRGLSVDDAARLRETRIGTVRTHLKRALEKTGTHRQSELVRLVLTGPTLLLRE